jgi:hypothetical protein
MAEEQGPLQDPEIQRAISNIKARSERQPDLEVLERTFVDTGILPQLQNSNNQILYGRRGTGKSHVLRILGAAHDRQAGTPSSVYIDMRMLGSAQMMTDTTQPLTLRCVSLFRDLLGEIQNALWDAATDPSQPAESSALEEVSRFTDALTTVAKKVSERTIVTETGTGKESGAHLDAKFGATGLGLEAGLSSGSIDNKKVEETYVEVQRETVVFAEVSKSLNEVLAALGLDSFLLLIDEWTAIPADLQPYVADFIKRSLMTCQRLTIKIASLEYRSEFSVQLDDNYIVGFEIGPDISANLDLDDYYVYDRNPQQVVASLLELLYRHVLAELPDDYLKNEENVHNAVAFRTRLFTEPATFSELVRAGEGVVRDFLGIFSMAYFRAFRTDSKKIDLSSIEEAARDWFETDKSANLSPQHQIVLNRIITDVIGNRQARSFLLERTQSNHPMVHSLFDLRLLHLMARGYSDKQNVGLRYNIYSLDYGTYVDLKRTKAQPEMVLVEIDEETPDRVVPFDDKRSIRRIVLDPSILDVD